MAIVTSPKGKWGVVAEFSTPAELFHACEKVRDAGFRRWDAHTPFPVHGLDAAMGLKRTPLPWIILALGLSGMATGLALQTWVHSVEYPLVISGKPFFAWPAYVPVLFELSVLFSALGAVFGMLGLNRLPMFNHPVFNSERFARATDDKFFISIEAADSKFDAARTPGFLSEIGASHVEFV